MAQLTCHWRIHVSALSNKTHAHVPPNWMHSRWRNLATRTTYVLGAAPALAIRISMTKLHAPGCESSTDSTCSTENWICIRWCCMGKNGSGAHAILMRVAPCTAQLLQSVPLIFTCMCCVGYALVCFFPCLPYFGVPFQPLFVLLQ